jgi:hypothetical protein
VFMMRISVCVEFNFDVVWVELCWWGTICLYVRVMYLLLYG